MGTRVSQKEILNTKPHVEASGNPFKCGFGGFLQRATFSLIKQRTFWVVKSGVKNKSCQNMAYLVPPSPP